MRLIFTVKSSIFNFQFSIANRRWSIVNGFFDFISEGIRGSISKLVIYSETHLHNFYNLGFGDKDETTGQLDDEVVTNNGDSEKVLATVASTLYIFMDKFTDAMVFAIGSTKARTRLYRIDINNNLSEMEEDFEVYGLVGDSWQPFQKQIEFDGFLVIKKKLIQQIRCLKQLDFLNSQSSTATKSIAEIGA